MALNTKTNIPIDTLATVPNINNLSGEAVKINELVNKTNRSNSGQNNFTSSSSGKTYNTVNYPEEPTIFNKGETGLYNLLIKLYGGASGWMITADDWNDINKELTSLDTKFSTLNTNLEKKVDTNSTNIGLNTQSINTISPKVTKAEKDITDMKNGTITVGNATNSVNATNATNAQNAVNATNAQTSVNATNCYTKAQCDSMFKIKGDFYVVTGTIPAQHDTFQARLSYPNGLNSKNCVVINYCASNMTLAPSIYTNGNNCQTTLSHINGLGAYLITLTDDVILLTVSPMKWLGGDDIGIESAYFKIVLMKI